MQIKTLENIEFSGNTEKSILESALAAGYCFEYSCKTGQCGACRTTLLKGEVREIKPQLALFDTDLAKHLSLIHI